MASLGILIPVGPLHAEHVKDAIASIEYGTAQPDEVLTIPDPDGRGAAATRNMGLDRIGTDYVYFLDADDYCMAETIAHLRGAIEREADYISALFLGIDGTVTARFPPAEKVLNWVRAGKVPEMGVAICVRT